MKCSGAKTNCKVCSGCFLDYEERKRKPYSGVDPDPVEVAREFLGNVGFPSCGQPDHRDHVRRRSRRGDVPGILLAHRHRQVKAILAMQPLSGLGLIRGGSGSNLAIA